ncbi:hypothetical protein ACFLTH_07435 [Bacteroidota bacterium]
MNKKSGPENLTLWQGIFLVEFLALIIGLATTIVPGKTGSEVGISGYFFEDPTFLEEFLVNFVSVNLIIILLGVIIYFWGRKKASKDSSAPDK